MTGPREPQDRSAFKLPDSLLELGRQAAAQKPDKHPAMVEIEEAHTSLRMALARHADQVRRVGDLEVSKSAAELESAVRRFERSYIELVNAIADEEGGS